MEAVVILREIALKCKNERFQKKFINLLLYWVYIEYFMESACVQCLHTSCGVSEIKHSERSKRARFLIQNNECVNTIRSTFHVVL